MRLAAAILLVLAFPVAAEEALSDRLPKGATAYLEAKDLARKLDDLLASPLAGALKGNEGLKRALAAPEVAQVRFVEVFVKGATGYDFEGLFRAIAGREIVAAAYGSPQRLVVLARVDPAAAERILAGAELLAKQQRTVVAEADGALPALWQLGPAFVCIDGDVLAASTDQLLAAAVRGRTAEGLQGDARIAQARRAAGGPGDAFAFVDLAVHAPGRKAEKAKDVNQALLAGMSTYLGAEVPWVAARLDVRSAGGGVRLSARALVPRPEAIPAAQTEAFGGTLEPFPYALPADTIVFSRTRRSLPALWSHRDALVAEREIPKLVEFETNFGNLTGGMDFVEQFLPVLGNEMAFLATPRAWPEGKPKPAIRLPQMAFLFPVRANEDLAMKLRIAFHTGIGIINATQGMSTQSFQPPFSETYKDVLIEHVRYMPATEGEIEANKGLPVRYNFEPAVALVGDFYVLATAPGIIKQLVDGRGGRTPAGENVNSGLWLAPAEARKSLVENREALIADHMLKKGDDRATSEQKIDFLLDVSRYLRAFSITAEESGSAFSLALEVEAAPPAE